MNWLKSKDWYWLAAGALVLGTVIGVLFFQSQKLNIDGAEIDWHTLEQADYTNNTYSKELQAFDGQEVKIPGFMVPLEDNMRVITEFLLVPSPQACIHVPPPPPNQMVLVKVDEGEKFNMIFGPVWVYGKLHLKTDKSMYGEASFELTAHRLEKYK